MTGPQPDDTVPARLAWRANATPTAAAFRYQLADGSWQWLDWQGFNRQVEQLRRGLSAAGLGKGDRLALVAPVSLSWELLHHAALGIGVSVVGLDAHDLPERLAAMADLAGVTSFAVADPAVLAKLSEGRESATRLRIAIGPEPDKVLGSSWTTLPALMALCQDHPAPSGPNEVDEATVIFTSGTTGAPKGIAYSHAQLALAIDAIAEAFSFVGTDGRLLCWLPLSNLFQRMVNLAAVQNGASTYLLGDPRQVMDHVARVRPDVFIGVPRFFEKLHDGLHERIEAMRPPVRALVNWGWQTGRRALACQRAGQRMPVALLAQHWLAERLVLRQFRQVLGGRLRCLVSGSAPMSRPLLDDFEALGWPFLEAYGLSENVVPVTMNTLAAHRPGTVGKPPASNQIRVSPEGNVYVKGPGLFNGYLGDDRDCRLDEHGWYDTRDLGSMDADGYLTLTGRSGEIIKTSTGRRIAPFAIESTLQRVIGIDQAILVGASRKHLIAICTCQSSDSLPATIESLRLPLVSALSCLSVHERPAAIGFLSRPFDIGHGELTTNLKLRRDAIMAQHQSLIDQVYAAVDSTDPPPENIIKFG